MCSSDLPLGVLEPDPLAVLGRALELYDVVAHETTRNEIDQTHGLDSHGARSPLMATRTR